MQTETTSTTSRKARKTAQPRAEVLPTRRDIEFNLPADKIKSWNAHGSHVTHFMNTLSILFPVGERFFIKAVRNYRDQITDEDLAKAVTAFIGQEAMHGREHEDYNDAVFAAVEDAEQQERFVKWLLGNLQKYAPKSYQLSATIALEHFTAIMADGLLRSPEILADAEPAFANVWTWHALEETEHKAVAYDVWEKVMGKGPLAYAQRASGLLTASAILWSVVGYYHLRTLRKEGELTNLKGWKGFFNVTLGQVGYFRKMAKPWADYFRPNFHPWDHDNRQFLKLLEDFPASVQKAS